MTNIKYSKRFKLRPEIGDVYFYVAVDEGRNKGVIHNETLFNKNNIKLLL